MDSLTKILEKIKQDNKLDCDEILQDANKKAEEIISNAEKNAEQIKSEILKNGEKQVENKLARYQSSAELEYRRSLLGARVEIIESTIKTALNTLCNLPKDEYFSLLLSLAEKYAEKGNAEFLLNDDDFAAMPQDFAKKLTAVLKDKGSVTLSGGGDLNFGGFKLVYAETVVNCGFDALLSDKLDDVKDSLSRILFE